jgi:hypothetical protein
MIHRVEVLYCSHFNPVVDRRSDDSGERGTKGF